MQQHLANLDQLLLKVRRLVAPGHIYHKQTPKEAVQQHLVKLLRPSRRAKVLVLGALHLLEELRRTPRHQPPFPRPRSSPLRPPGALNFRQKLRSLVSKALPSTAHPHLQTPAACCPLHRRHLSEVNPLLQVGLLHPQPVPGICYPHHKIQYREASRLLKWQRLLQTPEVSRPHHRLQRPLEVKVIPKPDSPHPRRHRSRHLEPRPVPKSPTPRQRLPQHHLGQRMMLGYLALCLPHSYPHLLDHPISHQARIPHPLRFPHHNRHLQLRATAPPHHFL